jgi:hypothetical protein
MKFEVSRIGFSLRLRLGDAAVFENRQPITAAE